MPFLEFLRLHVSVLTKSAAPKSNITIRMMHSGGFLRKSDPGEGLGLLQITVVYALPKVKTTILSHNRMRKTRSQTLGNQPSIRLADIRLLHLPSFPSSPHQIHPQHHEILFRLTHKSNLSYTHTPKREFLSTVGLHSRYLVSISASPQVVIY